MTVIYDKPNELFTKKSIVNFEYMPLYFVGFWVDK